MWNRCCGRHLARRPIAGDRRGFTLVELLTVVVIVGVLAAITIPKFANTKEKATIASMKSDLRNLASAQEAYWVDNRAYYGGPIPAAGFAYQPTQGVTISIVTATGAGWSASATAASSTSSTCAIFYGGVAPLPPASVESTPGCS